MKYDKFERKLMQKNNFDINES